ncbi:MAG: DUF432 domain-containing protein [Euryarchaeota archaeon]|nr:DUF432 domain-containing protein [Euryarchaeota archaeon]
MFSMKEFGIEIDEEKGKYIYRRDGTEKIVFGKEVSFDLFPVVSQGIASYLQLVFREPLALPPDESTDLKVTAPYDMEVRALKKDKWISIEKIPVQKEKYTLYGSVETGILCRYFESEFGEKINTASLHLKIKNRTQKWHEINKIVFPVNFDLYFDEKVQYPPFKLSLNDFGLTVTAIEKLETMEKIGSFMKDLKVQKEYTMRRGY